MASQSLPHSPQTYSIKEFQLVVRDAPVVPAEIKRIPFRSSLDVYKAFQAPWPVCHPRDVFRPAIANLTAGLIFLHNHPSSDPQPSQEDIQITERLSEVGKVVGIRVLDHIVIGQDCYFSFADQGLLS